MKGTLRILFMLAATAVALAAQAASCAPAAPCAPVPPSAGLSWRLPPGTSIEGDVLVAEIPADAAGRRDARAAAEIDVADALADGCCIVADVRCRATVMRAVKAEKCEKSRYMP